MKTKLRIGFDYDGVIGNTIDAVCQLYKERHPEVIHNNYPIPEFVTEWNFGDVLDITEEELDQYFCSERLFELMTFFGDSKLSMKSLLNELIADDNFEVFIITKGTFYNIAYKKKWLQERLPNFNLENFVAVDMDTVGKPDIKNCDVFIDDVDANFNGGAKYNLLFMNQGIKSWNMRGVYDDKLIKVRSVTELANTIFDLLEFEKGVRGKG